MPECRNCEEEISWKPAEGFEELNQNGKKRPLNAEGTAYHVCPAYKNPDYIKPSLRHYIKPSRTEDYVLTPSDIHTMTIQLEKIIRLLQEIKEKL